MDRRTFLVGSLSVPLLAAVKQERFDAAAAVLAKAVADGQVSAASLCVRTGKDQYARAFGTAKSIDSPFLLASITKTLSAAAVMTLHDLDKFKLDDPVMKFIPSV